MFGAGFAAVSVDVAVVSVDVGAAVFVIVDVGIVHVVVAAVFVVIDVAIFLFVVAVVTVDVGMAEVGVAAMFF